LAIFLNPSAECLVYEASPKGLGQPLYGWLSSRKKPLGRFNGLLIELFIAIGRPLKRPEIFMDQRNQPYNGWSKRPHGLAA
jgi:hypothetical protein